MANRKPINDKSDRKLNWERLNEFLKQRWFYLLFLLIVGFAVMALAKNIPVQRDLSYNNCQIEYGKILNEWDGSGKNEWNQTDYHYVTRLYRLEDKAPRRFFDNVIEVPPSKISTSHTGGEGCQPGFNGLVDTAADNMLWYGAGSVAARLGLPAMGEVNQNGQAFQSKLSVDNIEPSLQPPVFTESYDQAAAVIDDAGYVLIEDIDRTRQRLLWCQGYAPADTLADCQDQFKTNEPITLLSRGYLFTEDNCPIKINECVANKPWYSDFATKNIASVVGINPDKTLKSFYLHLNAFSSRGYQIGNWMSLTYKYPKLIKISANAINKEVSVKPGEEFSVGLNVSTSGPDIASVAVASEHLPSQIERLTEFNVKDESVLALNNDEDVKVSAKFKLHTDALGCFDVSIGVKTVSVIPVEGDAKPVTKNVTVKVCATTPIAATHNFNVATRGNVSINLDEFAALARETLSSVKGWTKAGIAFQKVNTGADFTIFLSTPAQMTSFSSGCDAVYSCRVGNSVIINEERWNKATPSWNQAGGSIRDYRHMVINHEVGHWLGFGHSNCSGAGRPAPVMQQQSINLQGCKFNPWPLESEISSLKARL
jgi:hypothetical protein